jgi:hypothetical protein
LTRASRRTLRLTRPSGSAISRTTKAARSCRWVSQSRPAPPGGSNADSRGSYSLIQCTMVPKVRYLGVHDLLAKQKEVRRRPPRRLSCHGSFLTQPPLPSDHSHPHQGHLAVARRPPGARGVQEPARGARGTDATGDAGHPRPVSAVFAQVHAGAGRCRGAQTVGGEPDAGGRDIRRRGDEACRRTRGRRSTQGGRGGAA